MPLDRDTREAFVDAVRRFVRERLLPAEREVEDRGTIPDALGQEMRDLGLFGLSIPEAYGGLGLSMAEEVAVVFELGYAAPAFRSYVGTNIGIGSQAIVLAGTEDQKSAYLPRLASGEIVGAFCLTEPDAGSDALSLRTRATPDADGFVIDGTKRYITNAPRAGLFTVLARTSPERRSGAISCFLVEAGTKGLIVGRPDEKMGQRGAPSADVTFDGCRVPQSALLGGETGTGFAVALSVLEKGRLHIAALCTGLAQRLLDEAVAYARERRQFGKPIAEFQLIQAMLADSWTEILAARAMIEKAAERKDAGCGTVAEASACKLFASELVSRVADRAVQIHGGAGYMREYAVERLYRDSRLFRIFEGTSEIQRIIIARSLTSVQNA